jgi:hypothetical protein
VARQAMWAGKSCCSFIAAFIAALLQHSCVLIYKSVHPSGRDIAALSQIYCSFITAHTDTIYKILGSDIAALSQIYCSFIAGWVYATYAGSYPSILRLYPSSIVTFIAA